MNNTSVTDIKEDDFTPVKLLSANMQSWIICVRVESIGQIRTFTYKQGAKQGQEGKVCNLVLFDNSGKIQLTLWTEEVDKFYSMI